MSPESFIYAEHEKFNKVERIEVKRCFVASQYIRKHDIGNKRYLPELSREEFEDRLRQAKQFVLQLSEEELDTSIADEYKKRLKAYNATDWYIGVVSPNEVGVWKGAGGLPVEWTNGSLAEKPQIKLSRHSKMTLTMKSQREQKELSRVFVKT